MLCSQLGPSGAHCTRSSACSPNFAPTVDRGQDIDSVGHFFRGFKSIGNYSRRVAPQCAFSNTSKLSKCLALGVHYHNALLAGGQRPSARISKSPDHRRGCGERRVNMAARPMAALLTFVAEHERMRGLPRDDRAAPRRAPDPRVSKRRSVRPPRSNRPSVAHLGYDTIGSRLLSRALWWAKASAADSEWHVVPCWCALLSSLKCLCRPAGAAVCGRPGGRTSEQWH